MGKDFKIKDEYEMINELVTEFDFEKAHKVMTVLEWKWCKQRDVPTIHEIKKEVTRRLFDYIIQLKEKEEDTVNSFYTHSGGFKITGSKKNGVIQHIELSFVVVEWMTYLPD